MTAGLVVRAGNTRRGATTPSARSNRGRDLVSHEELVVVAQ